MHIEVNGKSETLEPMRLADYLAQANLVGKRIAVEHNGEIVPKSQFESVELRDGDRLEIVQAIGGG
jgi:sulfur carrier protein